MQKNEFILLSYEAPDEATPRRRVLPVERYATIGLTFVFLGTALAGAIWLAWVLAEAVFDGTGRM